jgi:endoribonuclease Dicer
VQEFLLIYGFRNLFCFLVPLVSQQAEAIRLHTALNVTSFCGEAIEMDVNKWSKKAWLEKFEKNHVLVMTAKIYLDLLDNAKLKLSQANLLVFDECHRAKKKHDFKRIMDWFARVPSQDHPRILGLTASVLDGKVKPNMISEKIKDLEHTLRSVCKTASDPMVVEKYGAKPTESLREYSSSKHLNDVAKLEHEFRSLLKPLHAFLKDINFKVEIRDSRGSEEIFAKALAIAKSGVSECLAALKDIGIWGAYEVARMLADELGKYDKYMTVNN